MVAILTRTESKNMTAGSAKKFSYHNLIELAHKPVLIDALIVRGPAGNDYFRVDALLYSASQALLMGQNTFYATELTAVTVKPILVTAEMPNLVVQIAEVFSGGIFKLIIIYHEVK